MNKINEHTYQELFIEKKVRCSQQLYRIYYGQIWPCEKCFKEFLVSTDTSVKVEAAKKILYYFSAMGDFLFPNFIIDELITIQQYNLRRTEDYIPQDHLIHSINLYIFGIYSFFNMEVFHRKILDEYSGMNNEKKIGLFIKEWKLFALYHDIGYVLEGYVDGKGCFSNDKCIAKYKDIYDSLIYKHIIQAISKLILNIYILKQRGDKIEISQGKIESFEWVCNCKKITGIDLYEKIEKYRNYTQLKMINCVADRYYVDWLLQESEYLIVYENEFGIPLSFTIVNCNKEVETIYNSMFKSYEEYLVMTKSVNAEHDYKGIQCKYYVSGLREKIQSRVPRRFRRELFEYYNCISGDIKNKISLASNPNAIEYIYTSICKWLFKHMENFDPTMGKGQITEIEKASKKALENTFKEKIERDILDIIKTGGSTEERKALLINALESISLEELEIKIGAYYDEEFGTIAPIKHLYITIYESINGYLRKIPQSIAFNDTKMVFTPFEYEEEDEIISSIYSKMQDYSKRLEIDFDALKTYHTNYTLCDHGVVSSALLFQVITFNERLSKLLTLNSILDLAYYDKSVIDKLGDDTSTTSCAKVIFAILLHNIYTKRSRKYGIDYKQNLDVNAFSYFSALMDSLQCWGRPKQIDLAVIDLPKEHFLENDFDLVFTDYNINMICSTAYAGSMRNKINALEEYLPGASHIIKLCETEL